LRTKDLLSTKRKHFLTMVSKQTDWPKRRGYEFGVSKWGFICWLGERLTWCPKPVTVEMAQGKNCQWFMIQQHLNVWNEKLMGYNWSLTWNLQAYFNAPDGVEPLALDLSSMGKGQVWINGQSIGRYWMVYAKGACNSCNYAGTYRPAKCQLGCGQPTQQW